MSATIIYCIASTSDGTQCKNDLEGEWCDVVKPSRMELDAFFQVALPRASARSVSIIAVNGDEGTRRGTCLPHVFCFNSWASCGVVAVTRLDAAASPNSQKSARGNELVQHVYV